MNGFKNRMNGYKDTTPGSLSIEGCSQFHFYLAR